jgi:hypothetical protein
MTAPEKVVAPRWCAKCWLPAHCRGRIAIGKQASLEAGNRQGK